MAGVKVRRQDELVIVKDLWVCSVVSDGHGGERSRWGHITCGRKSIARWRACLPFSHGEPLESFSQGSDESRVAF